MSASSAGHPRGLQVVAPYWLDRPDEEVLDIALAARRNGFETMWLGEMATFDAFALATAVGLRAPGLALKIGPLAVGVRSPVALALGLASVATLTGARVDLALGASSPDIVSGWHDRPWAALAPRARETVEAVRSILAGERAAYSGEHVRTHGFRLKHPQPRGAHLACGVRPGDDACGREPSPTSSCSTSSRPSASHRFASIAMPMRTPGPSGARRPRSRFG